LKTGGGGGVVYTGALVTKSAATAWPANAASPTAANEKRFVALIAPPAMIPADKTEF
jgi:hypothetical protein